jgi:DNA-binding NarL/FixJ family response regulator
MGDKITVLIADDHVHERMGLRQLLSLVEGIEVIAEAASAQEAVQIAIARRPDVVLMDLRWYGDNTAGISAIHRIKAEAPEVRILAATDFPDELIEPARKAGADVAVGKDYLVSPQALEARIRDALASPFLPPPDEPLAEPLTERELEVLRLMAQGKTNLQIARHLQLAEGTVKKHVANVQGKLGAESRGGAVAAAYERGILRRGDVNTG